MLLILKQQDFTALRVWKGVVPRFCAWLRGWWPFLYVGRACSGKLASHSLQVFRHHGTTVRLGSVMLPAPEQFRTSSCVRYCGCEIGMKSPVLATGSRC
jgi:hypothetical protein